MIRHRLPNGLRVLVDGHPTADRVAVAVHYGVGFRTEPPGREGFAHLFEHLMFRGSANLPDGAFWDHVYASGGWAGGTTHQDYTDYWQVVPADTLERALFAEADRMRAPVFTPAGIAEQLAGVAEEIRAATVDRPYGGLPWPLLPAALFGSHADAHDGFGDTARLGDVSPADCDAFFDAHYAPSNAVLTVVGRLDPRRVLELVEENFARVPDRTLPPSDDGVVRVRSGGRLHGTEPGVARTAVALGVVLPDPVRDLRGYLAHMALARLAGPALSGPGRPPVDAGCGFFEPLDARSPDTMVLAGLLDDGDDPERFADRVGDGFRTLAAADALDGPALRVVGHLGADHRRRHAPLADRCRALGRWETLFGRGELLHELPGAIAELGVGDVRYAAARVAAAEPALVVLEPGPHRIRPAPPRPVPPRPWIPDVRTGEPLAPSPGPGPVPGAQARSVRTLARPAVHHERLGTSGRLVVLPDPCSELVTIRVRWPLSHAAVAAPDRTRAVMESVRASGTAALRRIDARAGSASLQVDGPWLDLAGDVPASGLARWLDDVGELLGREVTGEPGPPPPDAGPFAIGDLAWLAELVGPAPGAAPRGPGGLTAPGAVVVLAGVADPQAAGDRVREAFARVELGGGEPPRARAPGPPLLAVGRAADPVHHVTLHRTGPQTSFDDPAAFLATGLLGGYPGSRLVSRLSGRYQAFCGRDHAVGRTRSFVRAVVGPEDLHTAIAEITDELARTATGPVPPSEIAAVRRYCAGQCRGVLDSPSEAADAVCRAVASGAAPGVLDELPARLADVADSEVVAAARAMFDTRDPAAIVVGPPVPEQPRRDRRPAPTR